MTQNEKAKRQALLPRIKEERHVQDFDIEEWIKKSDDLEVPRKDGESDEAWIERKAHAEKTGHKANIKGIRDARSNMCRRRS